MISNEGSTAPSKSLKSCTPIFQHFLILSINSSLYANNECHTTGNGDAVQWKHVDTCIHLLMGCYIHRMKMNENGEVVNHINQHLFTLHISNSMLQSLPITVQTIKQIGVTSCHKYQISRLIPIASPLVPWLDTLSTVLSQVPINSILFITNFTIISTTSLYSYCLCIW